ncbi:MAG: sugar phosphate nucleotidyltransferase [Syntrophales bacterium]|nr:sugar phosphate nucleotidyltransferase [Syntrophales bacterium]
MTHKPKDRKIAAVILAAGKGTRMNSNMAKVLHPICGKPMAAYPIEAALALGADKTVVVIGHQAQAVRNALKDYVVLYAYQQRQLGTGHAVLQSLPALENFYGTVLILCGDVPLLLLSTLKSLIDCHWRSAAHVTVLTATPPDAGGYGRVIKDKEQRVLRIVEERDAGEEEKRVSEINTGIYCVESNFLFEALGSIGDDNVQKEYYLTDIVEIAVKKNIEARAFHLSDYREAMGINTVEQLKEADRIMASRSR